MMAGKDARRQVRVIKVGGSELDRPGFLPALAETLAAERLAQEARGEAATPTVLVHGGGKGIDALSARLGIVPERVAGLRRTDAATLAAVVMALCGQANTGLVAALSATGTRAVGLSGADDRLLACRQLTQPDLGYVGEVTGVNVGLLWALLDAGFLPVVAPIGIADDGPAHQDPAPRAQLYNVNADLATAAIAAALGARSVDFVTDVPGVMDGTTVLAELTADDIEGLITAGIIGGGMVLKVRAALAVVKAGVPAARIVNLAGLAGGGGTVVISSEGAVVHAVLEWRRA